MCVVCDDSSWFLNENTVNKASINHVIEIRLYAVKFLLVCTVCMRKHKTNDSPRPCDYINNYLWP